MSDDLWKRVVPLLSARPARRRRYSGRLPADDRAALRGIVYVLCKGVGWRDVPSEQTGCSGVTAWRRLRVSRVLQKERLWQAEVAPGLLFHRATARLCRVATAWTAW
ncbi:transposase [Streptomyces xanthochromogenes]|uniref:transposase n=1 Tax=Streptomyces xanthochromogenes TaxID=67384 RepID=UPI004032EB1F